MFICKSRPVQGMHQYVAKGRFYKLLFLNGDLYAWPSVLKKEKKYIYHFHEAFTSKSLPDALEANLVLDIDNEEAKLVNDNEMFS